MVSAEITRLVKVAGLSAGATLFVVNELGLMSKVEGNSMQPTFNPACETRNEPLKHVDDNQISRDELKRRLQTRLQQDRVILNKWSVKDKRNLKVGDIVILTSPTNPSDMLIKRIVAMPGDTIFIVETGETKQIDEGHCWVEGDNQRSSYDSNNFGQVPLGLIHGKVCYIVWPFRRMCKIDCDPEIVKKSTKTISISRR